jgi:hypothetical protein
VRLPRGLAGHWFLAAGGAWSIFLAVLILSLPYALTDEVVKAIGVYALFFGGLVSVAASEFRNVVRPAGQRLRIVAGRHPVPGARR